MADRTAQLPYLIIAGFAIIAVIAIVTLTGPLRVTDAADGNLAGQGFTGGNRVLLGGGGMRGGASTCDTTCQPGQYSCTDSVRVTQCQARDTTRLQRALARFGLGGNIPAACNAQVAIGTCPSGSTCSTNSPECVDASGNVVATLTAPAQGTGGGYQPPAGGTPPAGGGGTGGGTFASRCTADEREFCKSTPSDRMVSVPDSGPCPYTMSCYKCQDQYWADTHIDECLGSESERFSHCADVDGGFCETPAVATRPENRIGGTGASLMEYQGKVTGPAGTEWAGRQWSVNYYCANSQNNDPWAGGYYCYRCAAGYEYVAASHRCVSVDSTCDTTNNCLDAAGNCYAVNTIISTTQYSSTGCADDGTGPRAYVCSGSNVGRTITSRGVTFCCNNQRQWTGDLTDCND